MAFLSFRHQRARIDKFVVCASESRPRFALFLNSQRLAADYSINKPRIACPKTTSQRPTLSWFVLVNAAFVAKMRSQSAVAAFSTAPSDILTTR
ncbi:hypothetical protein [Bradyrhizobium sp. USDA 4454]